MSRIGVRVPLALVLVLQVFCSATWGLVWFHEKDGVVSVEAEHADAVGQWKEEGPADGSSGTFMRAVSSRSRDDRMEFNVIFIKPGWYRVWLRSRCTTDKDNDCYVTLDNKPGCVPLRDGWHPVTGIKTNYTTFSGWDSQVKEEGLPLEQRLNGCHVFVAEPGSHRFALGARSRGYKIDKVVLLHLDRDDAADGPSGTGPAETWTYPRFSPAAETSKVRSIQKAISSGVIGRKLPLLVQLVQESDDPAVKGEAAYTLNTANEWIKIRSESITAMHKEGRAVGVLLEAGMVSKAVEGHPVHEKLVALRAGIRYTGDFEAGVRFYQLLKMAMRLDNRQQVLVLDQFIQKYPQTWYAKFARTLTKQGLRPN